MKFTTKLAGEKWCGGFGASGNTNPSRWADELWGEDSVPGPWLCCYMLRRFGWPNSGSDDYKELMSWTLATPIPGLYLGVTPYLGGSNLHFSVRFDKKVEALLRQDPGRESFFRRYRNSILRWWDAIGKRLYVLGTGLQEGDTDELVEACCSFQRNGKAYSFGLWKRRPKQKQKFTRIPKNMDLWWIGDFIREKHPEFKLTKLNKREKARSTTRFQLRVRSAIKATLLDLLRPTHVRDISFTPFGDIENTPAAVNRYTKQKDTGYFVGAGNTPEYWYKHATPKERRRES